MELDDLYVVAIHESGHAVMSATLHRGIDFVTIIPTEDCVGLCRHTETNLDEYTMEYETYKRKIRREILILLAGYIATGHYEFPMNWRDTEIESDIDKVFDVIGTISGDGEKTGKEFDRLWNRTIKIIQQPLVKRQIKAVADALMDKQRLSGKQVRNIMKAPE